MLENIYILQKKRKKAKPDGDTVMGWFVGHKSLLENLSLFVFASLLCRKCLNIELYIILT